MVDRSKMFGKYRLLKRLAQGGMAEIFLASQSGAPALGRLVVIKRVLPRLGVSADFVKMFLDEARIVARLDHPHIVRIFDLGQIDGQYYIAMEYIAGEDQSSVLREARSQGVQLPLGYAAEVILGAAEALTSAHQMKDADGRPLRVVHRDVTPSNILATWRGSVKLVDFGVAHTASNFSRTEDGVVKGKLSYLSPEQCRGTRADSRTDLYALGVVLYELVSCAKLFFRDSPLATVKAILAGEVPPLESSRAGVPLALQAVVKRAMALDPEQRYQTGAELAADLKAYLASTGWVRGADSVAFLTTLFGEERKQAKLRLADGHELNDEGYAALDAVRPLPTARLTPRGMVQIPLGALEPSGLVSTLDHDDGEVSTRPLRRRPEGLTVGVQPGLHSELEEPRTSPVTSVSGLRERSTARQAAASEPEPSTSPVTLVPSRLRDGSEAPTAQPVHADAESPTIGLGIARPVELGDAVLPSTSLEQPVGRLRIRGLPAEARVTVDGTSLVPWDEENAFPIGSRVVVVEAPGFQTFERSLELLPGELVELEVKLVPSEPPGSG